MLRDDLAGMATGIAGAWFFERVRDCAAGDTPVALVERVERRAGVMAPLQVHTADVHYRVLEGSLTFYVGAERIVAAEGGVVVVRRGTPHTYRVDEAGTRWLVLARVTSIARFEDLGRAHAEPGLWTLEDRATLDAIAAPNAIRILGPPGALPPARYA